MESASLAGGTGGGVEVVDKGLKKNAISFVSNIVIGVASTAPGYSLAATLGFVVAIGGIGLQAPAVMLVAFIPMFCIAMAYNYMNRADPDCGTTFSWVTRAIGPRLADLRGAFEQIAAEEVARALRQELRTLDDQQRGQLERLASTVAHRLAHLPLAGLRAAAVHGPHAVEAFFEAARTGRARPD